MSGNYNTNDTREVLGLFVIIRNFHLLWYCIVFSQSWVALVVSVYIFQTLRKLLSNTKVKQNRYNEKKEKVELQNVQLEPLLMTLWKIKAESS